MSLNLKDRQTMKYITTKDAVKGKPAVRRGRKAMSPIQDSQVTTKQNSIIE